MESLIAGFVGAVVGALASILTVLIQARTQAQRDRLKLAAELALQEFKVHVELSQNKRGSSQIMPVTVYLYYHLELAKLMERDGVTHANLKSLNHRLESIERVFRDRSEKRKPVEHEV
jgi:uncharacterized membrane protein